MADENLNDQFADPAAMTGKLQNVEVFKVGKHRGSRTVNADGPMLDRIVSNFNSINKIEGYGVPVKLGHSSKVGSPAYGWMSDLTRVGDTLVADFADMDPAIVDAISKRRYNSVSVELYPRIEHGGKIFNDVLGGVALLGAEWPAVKGLKPLSASMFAEVADEKLELTEEPTVANEATTFTQETHDALVLAATTKQGEKHATELKAATDATAVEKARADKAETELKAFRDAADKASIDALITAAEKSGKIVPANKDKMVKLAGQVMKATDLKDRAELMTTLTELLDGMKPKVTFGENGRSEAKDPAEQATKASDRVDTAAKALLSADTSGKMTYEQAAKAALAADDELRHDYATEM